MFFLTIFRRGRGLPRSIDQRAGKKIKKIMGGKSKAFHKQKTLVTLKTKNRKLVAMDKKGLRSVGLATSITLATKFVANVLH